MAILSLQTEYQMNGYKDRSHYLSFLKDQYSPEAVDALTSVLPPSEDFEALLIELDETWYLYQEY